MIAPPQFDAAEDGPAGLPRRETRFLALVASAASADAERVLRIGAALVGCRDPHARFHSRLNNDGSPLQACVSLRHSYPLVWRLLGDPFSDDTDAVGRFVRTRRKAVAIVASYADDRFARIVEGALCAAIAPNDRDGDPARRRGRLEAELSLAGARRNGGASLVDHASPLALGRGSIWIGLPLLGRGVAIYVNGRVLGAQVAWGRVSDWLGALNGSQIAEQIQLLSSGRAELASVGVEGADAATALIKLYFRLQPPITFRGLDVNASQRAALAEFVDCIVGSRIDARLAANGILICIGISAHSGDITDVKLDLCGHCLAFDASSWHCQDVGALL